VDEVAVLEGLPGYPNSWGDPKEWWMLLTNRLSSITMGTCSTYGKTASIS
jgi:hypothetical protein